jgi:hypothetical protein
MQERSRDSAAKTVSVLLERGQLLKLPKLVRSRKERLWEVVLRAPRRMGG